MYPDITDICQVISDEDLGLILDKFGLGRLRPMASQIRAAICGDTRAAAAVETAAAAMPSCSCKGRAVKALTAAAYNGGINPGGTGKLAGMARVVPGGGSGLNPGGTQILVAPNLDWNCGTHRRDLETCDLERLAREQYPAINVQLTETGNLDAWNLPTPPAGQAWFTATVLSEVLEVDKASQNLCLNSFAFSYDTNPVTPVVIERFGVAGERLVDFGNSFGHAIDYWSFIPRQGYEITDGRCRCVREVCVCNPVQGRLFIALRAATSTSNTMSGYIEFDRRSVGGVCGPCPPAAACERPKLNPDPCSRQLQVAPQ